MTPSAQYRLLGFRETLRLRGRKAKTDAGVELPIVVEDRVPLTDLEENAKAKKIIYVMVHALADAVESPRAVIGFTEVKADGSDGRYYDVISWDENASDEVKNQWLCEAQRA